VCELVTPGSKAWGSVSPGSEVAHSYPFGLYLLFKHKHWRSITGLHSCRGKRFHGGYFLPRLSEVQGWRGREIFCFCQHQRLPNVLYNKQAMVFKQDKRLLLLVLLFSYSRMSICISLCLCYVQAESCTFAHCTFFHPHVLACYSRRTACPLFSGIGEPLLLWLGRMRLSHCLPPSDNVLSVSDRGPASCPVILPWHTRTHTRVPAVRVTHFSLASGVALRLGCHALACRPQRGAGVCGCLCGVIIMGAWVEEPDDKLVQMILSELDVVSLGCGAVVI